MWSVCVLLITSYSIIKQGDNASSVQFCTHITTKVAFVSNSSIEKMAGVKIPMWFVPRCVNTQTHSKDMWEQDSPGWYHGYIYFFFHLEDLLVSLNRHPRAYCTLVGRFVFCFISLCEYDGCFWFSSPTLRFPHGMVQGSTYEVEVIYLNSVFLLMSFL